MRFISRKETSGPATGHNQRDAINLSSCQPTAAEACVLCRGMNFNTDRDPDKRKVICCVEQAVNRLPPSKRDEVRSRAIGVISKRPKGARPSNVEKQAISLRCKDNIVALPADKGTATVLLDREDYDGKMRDLLEDKETYARLQRDHTGVLQKKLQELLVDIFRFVPPDKKGLYYRLLCTNGSATAIYGLPKVHKTGVSLRLIVDFSKSPIYSLSKYLHGKSFGWQDSHACGQLLRLCGKSTQRTTRG